MLAPLRTRYVLVQGSRVKLPLFGEGRSGIYRQRFPLELRFHFDVSPSPKLSTRYLEKALVSRVLLALDEQYL
jgi:hypothetical protein